MEDSGWKETILAVSKRVARRGYKQCFVLRIHALSAHDTCYKLKGLDGIPIDADEIPTDLCIKCPCIMIGHFDNAAATPTSVNNEEDQLTCKKIMTRCAK